MSFRYAKMKYRTIIKIIMRRKHIHDLYQQLINIRKPYILYLLKYFTRTLIDNLSPMNNI